MSFVDKFRQLRLARYSTGSFGKQYCATTLDHFVALFMYNDNSKVNCLGGLPIVILASFNYGIRYHAHVLRNYWYR